jgi:hypothetical protein
MWQWIIGGIFVYWLIGGITFAWPLYFRMLDRDFDEGRILTVKDHIVSMFILPLLWPVFFMDLYDKWPK